MHAIDTFLASPLRRSTVLTYVGDKWFSPGISIFITLIMESQPSEFLSPLAGGYAHAALETIVVGQSLMILAPRHAFGE